ncbi:MAG: hypothetical protein P8Y63_13535, partial [Deltaproteobacteria bacterium]
NPAGRAENSKGFAGILEHLPPSFEAAPQNLFFLLLKRNFLRCKLTDIRGTPYLIFQPKKPGTPARAGLSL